MGFSNPFDLENLKRGRHAQGLDVTTEASLSQPWPWGLVTITTRVGWKSGDKMGGRDGAHKRALAVWGA